MTVRRPGSETACARIFATLLSSHALHVAAPNPKEPKMTAAAKNYAAAQAAVQERIAALDVLLAAHAAKVGDGSAHYGHVGDLTHVRQNLDDLIAFLAA
jgi:hypothetical protein